MRNERWFWIGVIVVLLVIIFLNKCNRKPVAPGLAQSDTVYVEVVDSNRVKIPEIVSHTERDTIILDGKPYPVTKILRDTVKVKEIVTDYYSTNYYSDTNTIALGQLIINDSISENRIKSRQLHYNYRRPVITNTMVTPQRTQVYVGLSAGGQRTAPLYMIGANLSLKTKKDRIYEIGASVTKDKHIIYQAGLKWKL